MDKKTFRELLNKGIITHTGFVNNSGIEDIVEAKTSEELETEHIITVPEAMPMVQTPEVPQTPQTPQKKTKSKSKSSQSSKGSSVNSINEIEVPSEEPTIAINEIEVPSEEPAIAINEIEVDPITKA